MPQNQCPGIPPLSICAHTYKWQDLVQRPVMIMIITSRVSTNDNGGWFSLNYRLALLIRSFGRVVIRTGVVGDKSVVGY
ncbi:hypothetical protein CEXT_419811 [Caerostris extrusa]|uniref:Uncharacterized protein n=1 Tax=Caerostris extrusa TaxID=172846 RepID=A0AAV4T862_CAEEX|nr:hypothetical protein CEXT_419811 [Caerostris extrusa]